MNPEFRKRILSPSLIPLGAFVFIGALVFGFSRLLLVVTKEGSVVLGVLMAASILFAAGAVSKGGKLKDSQRAGLVVFALLVIGGGVAAGAAMNTREVEKEAEVRATITAKNIAFDKKEFKLPADTPVGIRFINNDPGVPHNVAIYDTPAAGKTLLPGAIFPGVRTRVYEIEEGLPRGVYFFRCDVHLTTMTGRVIVGNVPTPPPSPAPTPTSTGPAPASSPSS